MPFGDIGFSGYWDAANNRVVGRAGRGLFDMRDGQVQLYRVVVAGNTSLSSVNSWNVGDYAYYNGFEWDKLIGQGSLTSAVNAFFANLPTQPPASGPGLWLDGNMVVFS